MTEDQHQYGKFQVVRFFMCVKANSRAKDSCLEQNYTEIWHTLVHDSRVKCRIVLSTRICPQKSMVCMEQRRVNSFQNRVGSTKNKPKPSAHIRTTCRSCLKCSIKYLRGKNGREVLFSETGKHAQLCFKTMYLFFISLFRLHDLYSCLKLTMVSQFRGRNILASIMYHFVLTNLA